MALRIYFLRHGLPEHSECLRGISDFALTDDGFTQMERSYSRITDKVDMIISSPLSRCLTFAEFASNKLNVPLKIDGNWQELDFGDWDGESRKVLEEKYPDEVISYWKEPWDNTPPNAECLDELQIRTRLAFDDLCQKYEDKVILIVTHSAVMRMMLMEFLDITPRSNSIFASLQMPYAALMCVDAFNVNGKIKTIFHYPS
ncbi:MAG: histidine phosphatase family protein [Alphaproteobacteria bacterium]